MMSNSSGLAGGGHNRQNSTPAAVQGAPSEAIPESTDQLHGISRHQRGVSLNTHRPEFHPSNIQYHDIVEKQQHISQACPDQSFFANQNLQQLPQFRPHGSHQQDNQHHHHQHFAQQGLQYTTPATASSSRSNAMVQPPIFDQLPGFNTDEYVNTGYDQPIAPWTRTNIESYDINVRQGRQLGLLPAEEALLEEAFAQHPANQPTNHVQHNNSFWPREWKVVPPRAGSSSSHDTWNKPNYRFVNGYDESGEETIRPRRNKGKQALMNAWSDENSHGKGKGPALDTWADEGSHGKGKGRALDTWTDENYHGKGKGRALDTWTDDNSHGKGKGPALDRMADGHSGEMRKLSSSFQTLQFRDVPPTQPEAQGSPPEEPQQPQKLQQLQQLQLPQLPQQLQQPQQPQLPLQPQQLQQPQQPQPRQLQDEKQQKEQQQRRQQMKKERRRKTHRRNESTASMMSAASIASINVEELKMETGVHPEEIAKYIREPAESDGKWTCLFEACNKLFGRKENIKSHVQTHLNDRQYRCPSCHKCFVRQHDLRRHAKIHTGVKPYPCKCGNEFARHDALTRHRQRGMCIGAVDGAVRRAARRGRPPKDRGPDAEARPAGDGGRAATRTATRAPRQRCQNMSISSSASSMASFFSDSSMVHSPGADSDMLDLASGRSLTAVMSPPGLPGLSGMPHLPELPHLPGLAHSSDPDPAEQQPVDAAHHLAHMAESPGTDNSLYSGAPSYISPEAIMDMPLSSPYMRAASVGVQLTPPSLTPSLSPPQQPQSLSLSHAHALPCDQPLPHADGLGQARDHLMEWNQAQRQHAQQQQQQQAAAHVFPAPDDDMLAQFGGADALQSPIGRADEMLMLAEFDDSDYDDVFFRSTMSS